MESDELEVSVSKFKVGDRVAVYSNYGRYEGEIKYFSEDGTFPWIDYDNNDFIRGGLAHPKQCRRLKPKPAIREYWMNIYATDYHSVHSTKEDADIMGPHRVECIKVREKRK